VTRKVNPRARSQTPEPGAASLSLLSRELLRWYPFGDANANSFQSTERGRPAQYPMVLDSQVRTNVARQKLRDEIIRAREAEDKFHNSLALFSGGTIALSITYLGYLKNTAGRPILFPRVLIAAWLFLLVCAVASLFSPLVSSYYSRISWRRIYDRGLAEQKAAEFQQMFGGLATLEEKQEDEKGLSLEAEARRKDSKWAKTKLRESVYKALLMVVRWVARLAFPIGLGLLMFFAVKNM